MVTEIRAPTDLPAERSDTGVGASTSRAPPFGGRPKTRIDDVVMTGQGITTPHSRLDCPHRPSVEDRVNQAPESSCSVQRVKPLAAVGRGTAAASSFLFSM
jgi:hypothetical protein